MELPMQAVFPTPLLCHHLQEDLQKSLSQGEELQCSSHTVTRVVAEMTTSVAYVCQQLWGIIYPQLTELAKSLMM